MQTTTNFLRHVWYLLETFKPEKLETVHTIDHEEIYFLKDGVSMRFWASCNEGMAEADINDGKEFSTHITGSYNDILKKLEKVLGEANE